MQPLAKTLQTKKPEYAIKNLRFNKLNNNLKPSNSKVSDIQLRADRLADELAAPKHLPFFLKVCWRIPAGRIDWLLATAKEMGRNPLYYFIALAKQEM